MTVAGSVRVPPMVCVPAVMTKLAVAPASGTVYVRAAADVPLLSVSKFTPDDRLIWFVPELMVCVAVKVLDPRDARVTVPGGKVAFVVALVVSVRSWAPERAKVLAPTVMLAGIVSVPEKVLLPVNVWV